MTKVLYLYDDHFLIKDDQYTKKQLEEWYLAENKSVKDLQDLLNTSKSTIDRVLKYYGLRKDKHLAGEVAKKTMIQKYGVESYSKTEEYRQKYEQTCLKKYGVKSHNQSGQVKEKYKNTCLSKYGVATTAVLEDVVSQRENTCFLKYGVANPAQSEAVQLKIKQTNLERYGVESFSKTEEFLSATRKTCLEKYGETSYSKTPEHRRKTSALSKAYAEKGWSDECKAVMENKDSLVAYLETLGKKPTTLELADMLGCSISAIGERVRLWGLSDMLNLSYSTSSYEKEIKDYLGGLGVAVAKDRTQLDGLEIDLYDQDRRVGIEFNGTYWHSISMIGDIGYHFKKSKLAESRNIRLIHIYEYEWNDPKKRPLIESLLRISFGKVGEKIYARKCVIREITNKEAKPFNEQNHLQGHRNAQVSYGLFYKGKLVQLMSFSKTRYNRNLDGENSWEIIRGCPGSNNIVIGGVSKLFKHFIKEYNPDSVFSYCDFNKFDGRGYEAIGMKFIGYTGPDLKWVMKDRTVVNRQPSRHAELKNGSIDKIYGAGSKKYLWEKK